MMELCSMNSEASIQGVEQLQLFHLRPEFLEVEQQEQVGFEAEELTHLVSFVLGEEVVEDRNSLFCHHMDRRDRNIIGEAFYQDLPQKGFQLYTIQLSS